ncbi:MAG: hypothetical protein LBR51_08030 [Bacteroidales bacterium]|jgi:hypothetical protein|nr:hypothetical protein [Bacteroidales bacterium]
MCVSGSLTAFSQHDLTQSTSLEGDVVYNRFGDFIYQYSRIITRDTLSPTLLWVTVVFINGNVQAAITYRQEIVNARFEWISTEAGRDYTEGYVKGITAILVPHQVISWRYSYETLAPTANGEVEINRASLLVMNDNLNIDKVLFHENKFKTTVTPMKK